VNFRRVDWMWRDSHETGRALRIWRLYVLFVRETSFNCQPTSYAVRCWWGA
jgi:hypothetical protein